MAKAKLKATLSETSLDQLKKELESLAKELDKSVEKSTKELGEKSLEYMQKQYSENNLDGHIKNLNLKAYKSEYKKGFILSSGNDIVAVFNEYGTGLAKGTTNTLASWSNYEYNVPSVHKGVVPVAAMLMYGEDYCSRVNTPDTWWYFKDGKWWHSKGAAAKNMYSSLVDKLNEVTRAEMVASLSQTIGKYGGK